jgi:phosphoribosylglycinamide formyltransferase 1
VLNGIISPCLKGRILESILAFGELRAYLYFWVIKSNQPILKKIAILASGSGSNAEEIIKHFQHSSKGKVVLIGSNKSDAFVLERAKNFDVPTFTFNRSQMEAGELTQKLQEMEVDFVVLGGFLLKIPNNLIQAYPDHIINIHPALLPKYGGKGMYGMKVHEAVKNSGDKETGITIHLVNEHYDEGKIIFQAAVPIITTDSPEEIAQKVHQLEYKYFPNVIESLL